MCGPLGNWHIDAWSPVASEGLLGGFGARLRTGTWAWDLTPSTECLHTMHGTLGGRSQKFKVFQSFLTVLDTED